MACLKLQSVFSVDRPSGIRVNANKDGKLLSVDSREAELVVLRLGDLDAFGDRAKHTEILAKALHYVGYGSAFDREIQVDIHAQRVNPVDADLSVPAEPRGCVLELFLKPGFESLVGDLAVQNIGTSHADCDPEALHRLVHDRNSHPASSAQAGHPRISSRSSVRPYLRPTRAGRR